MRDDEQVYSVPRELVEPFVVVSGGSGARLRALRLLEVGDILCGSFPAVSYGDGRCWTEVHSRSHGRWLHGFLFLADWHLTLLGGREGASHQGEAEAVTVVADLFLRWQELVGSSADPPEMAFHDETTAQRLLQLVRFLDDHAPNVDPSRRAGLEELAGVSANLLMEDDFYGGLNNHGMFQDLALLRYAAHGGWDSPGPTAREASEKAIDRLTTYFRYAFTSDGVHVENSPGYHFMVARQLRDVLPLALLLDPARGSELKAIYEGAEEFATHLVYPDGSVAPLGDTKVFAVDQTRHRNTFDGLQFDFAVSGGARGVAPSERSAVFSEGGYAIHRTAWGDPHAYVLSFKAAYLSGYHHHSDELALTIFGQGHWLLTEAGPFGYEYDNPLTKYAYSQYAHNTVVIDGRSLPRVDPQAGGVALHEVWPREEATLMHVRGVNRRYDAQPQYVDAVHTRELRVLEPAQPLNVEIHDTVQHPDGGVHTYEMLWHVGPGVRTQLTSEGAELFIGSTKALEIGWHGPSEFSAEMVRPSKGPKPRAMRFPTFGRYEAGSVICLTSRGVGLGLKTTIRSGEWIIGGGVETKPSISMENRFGRVVVRCRGLTPQHYVGVYLEQDGAVVAKRVYEQGSTEFVFDVDAKGSYRAKVFVKSVPSQRADVYISSVLIV